MFDWNWTAFAVPMIVIALVFAWTSYKINREEERLKKLWDELVFRGAIEEERQEVFGDLWCTELVSPYRRESGNMLTRHERKLNNGKTNITISMFDNSEYNRLTIEEFIRKTDKDIPFPASS